jgi:hypothetical protein
VFFSQNGWRPTPQSSNPRKRRRRKRTKTRTTQVKNTENKLAQNDYYLKVI